MTTDIEMPWFRDLYENVLGYTGQRLYEDVLTPWIERGQDAASHFSFFKQPSDFDKQSDDHCFAMWNLYALNRVNDLFLLPFQKTVDRPWSGPQVTEDQYVEFFTNIGFAPFKSDTYTPIRHEIVEVIESQHHAEPIGVLESLWPGLMFGTLLFSRSGVRVLGGSDHILKEVAENSMLHFTFRRLHRRTTDLSIGWGSNSQWRTSIRRDYESDGALIYNFDGDMLLNDPAATEKDWNPLTAAERLELCKNRCFIMSKTDDSDLYPYEYRFEEKLCAYGH